MESQDDVEAAKKQSPLRVVEVDFVFSLRAWIRIHALFLPFQQPDDQDISQ